MDLSAFLAAHRIDPACHAHPPVMTVAESERLVPPLPGAKTKNLFLRDRKGVRHFLVTVPHALAVDLAALGEALTAGRLGFASPDRLLRHLGVTPGSVSLLALVNDTAHAVEFVVDRTLWEAVAVQAHPLRNDATMVIAHADLERFLAATGHVPRVIDVPGQSSPAVSS
jgi:Ala-tRNA(Pro) deacylase